MKVIQRKPTNPTSVHPGVKDLECQGYGIEPSALVLGAGLFIIVVILLQFFAKPLVK